jgi:hypothetical protein
VQSALRVLSHRERQAMILHYLEGRSCEEVATHLRTSVGNVRQILFNSRRKAREEIREMTLQETQKKGPRRLVKWIDGLSGAGNANILLTPLLAQTICLDANKTAKTAAQIASEVDSNVEYVEETAEGLLQYEILESPKKGRYLTNFIAIDAADWRRLVGKIHEPAARVAKQLTQAGPTLRTAYERTPLAASGWSWDDITWTMFGFPVTFGVSRNISESLSAPPPVRPGGSYFIGGYEFEKEPMSVWFPAFNLSQDQPLHNGYFRIFGLAGDYRLLRGETEISIVSLLSEGPLNESETLSRLGGEPDQYRGTLAQLVKDGFVTLVDGTLRLAIPVFTQSDSDILTPVIDDIIRPIITGIAEPAFSDIQQLFDDMGYEHCRDQYPRWHRWLTGGIFGEALRFLVEQDFLPRLPEPIPYTFAFAAWKGDLPLMGFGMRD